MKQSVVEFLLEKYKSQNTLLFAEDWQQAKEMEKEQLHNIREMLIEGALTNMSCSSAIVEFDKLTFKSE